MNSATTSSRVSRKARRCTSPDLWQALEHRGLLQNVQVLPEAGQRDEILSLLMDCAKEAEILDEEQVNKLLYLFVAKLTDLWGKCLKQCA